MATNYTTLQVQTGGELRILRKLQAQVEHTRDADDADFHKRLLTVANGYNDQDDEEARALGNAFAHFDNVMLTSLIAVWNSYKTDHVEDSDLGYFHVLASEVVAAQADIDVGNIAYVYQNLNGAISISNRTGILGKLHGQMLTDRQMVLANGLTIGALTPKSTNRGVLTATTLKGLSHALSGTVTLRVLSETVELVTFTISNKLTKPLVEDGSQTVSSDRSNTLETQSEDGPTGLTIELLRPGLAAPTELGDDGNIFSVVSIATPKSGDSDFGIFFITVTRNSGAPDFTIEFFKEAGRTTSLGTQDVTGITGNIIITKTLTNGSAITFTFDKANAATKLPTANDTDNDISYDIVSPRIGDEWTFTVVNDRVANFATKFGDTWRFSPPAGIASGAAATGALAGAGAGNVDDGTHSYKVSFVHPDGESQGGTTSNVVTVADKGVDGQVSLTSVPLGPAGTTARNIYRTIAGDTGAHKFVGVIGDNTTTTFNDNVADASLVADALVQWIEANAASVSMI